MFISKAEKKHLLDSAKLISALIKDVADARTEIIVLKAKVKVLEERRVAPYVWTDDQRKAQSERMKNAWARKKEPQA